MVDLELFESDIVVVECIRFCFMKMLHNELNSILNDWNSHIISKSRNSVPRSRPDSILFFLPHHFNASDYSVEVDPEELENFEPVVSYDEESCSAEFREFAKIIMDRDEKSEPTNPNEALDLYLHLLSQVKEYS